MAGYELNTKGVMYSFLDRSWLSSRKRLNFGNENGSYFKRAPKEPTKSRRRLWMATEGEQRRKTG